ncbi:MAG: hypothetical protein ACFFA4_17020 [Promethearchaeota archaeon]
MEIDAEKAQVKAPIKLVIAIAAAFVFWWVSTYVIPLSDQIIKLKEDQARDKAEHQAMDERIRAAERREERLEDRVNAFGK